MAPLPSPPPEVPVVRSPEGLAPAFRVKVESLLDRMRTRGHDPFVFESTRTDERQTYLYGFGRTYDDGRGVVTHSSDADETWHHFGLAVDIISKKHLWDAPKRFWADLGVLSAALGLQWGGAWKSFKDLPHVQWGAPMRQSPSPRAARLLASGGMEAVWREVGAMGSATPSDHVGHGAPVPPVPRESESYAPRYSPNYGWFMPITVDGDHEWTFVTVAEVRAAVLQRRVPIVLQGAEADGALSSFPRASHESPEITHTRETP
jgi:hypothetical protein